MINFLTRWHRVEPQIRDFLHSQDEQILVILDMAKRKLEAQPQHLSRAKSRLILHRLRQIPMTIYWTSGGKGEKREMSNSQTFWITKGTLKDIAPEKSDFYTALYSVADLCHAVDSPIKLDNMASYGFPLTLEMFEKR